MRAPLSWLREYAPIEGDVAALAVALSSLGLVVDGVQQIGEGLDGIVVARVLATRPHPAADRVHLVDVDAGDGEALQVVCGAFNMKEGDLVPLATLGTVMPGEKRIERSKIRGEWSNGMLCSSDELGLPPTEEGIRILPTGVAKPGTPLAEALGLQPDVVFDLDITPNRPDAMSIVGVARDLAAYLKIPFTPPDPSPPATPVEARIRIEAPDLCPRFTGTVLEGVTIAPSPDWVVRRLTLAGMRAINNVVDASNYVMLEMGQPTHPYDLDLLPGRGLSVRRANDGEPLTTLDGERRRLQADDCLICDFESTPVGVAGIMGGASSEISDTTTTVFLEAAYFQPISVARTARRLGLRTEASARFERGVDPEGIARAVGRFCELLPGTRATAGMTSVDSVEHLPRPAVVRLRTQRVNALLGTSLSDEEIAGYLKPIGFETVPVELGVQAVTVPSFRPDSSREADVIEEVARHYGYERIPKTLPTTARHSAGLTDYQRERRTVRDVLAGSGLTEAWTTSFLAPGDLERAGLPADAIEVENPMVREEAFLRPSLLPGLLKAVAFNVAHQEPALRLFEISHVFLPPAVGDGPLPEEPEYLAVALAGPGGDARAAAGIWAVLADALRVDDMQLVPVPPHLAGGLHPTRSQAISCSGAVVGVVGEVDPAVVAAFGAGERLGWIEIDLGMTLAAPRRLATLVPVSRFPASDIDLAFVVADLVPAATVAATLRHAGGELLEGLELFDVFRGGQLPPAHRSLAYRLRFRAQDRTLTDSEVAELRTACIAAVETAHHAALRG
jgi:phenylalanyl-tRNA synthetase beta chain